MGEQILVESSIGMGSTFYFTIPYESSINQDIMHEENNPVQEIPNYENISILVAEDDIASFIYLKRLLQKTKAKVIYASNGLQAIEMVNKTNDIKLILMDIKMPVMSGVEALYEIRKQNFQMPVIAQTAYAFSDEVKKIKEAGFNDYISKPINSINLFLIMNKYLKDE